MRIRFWLAVSVELLLFAALNLFSDWTLEIMPIKFVATAILAGLAYLIAASEFNPTRKNGALLLWSVTILLRLLALPLPPSDEFWRGQAEGLLQRQHFNPYQTPPSSTSAASLSHATDPAAFAPATELLFRALPSGSSLPAKLVFGLAELLAIALLARLIGVRETAWFAWNPLLAYSFVGAAHFDACFLLALTVLIYCLTRSRRDPVGWALGAAGALGTAMAFRPIALVLFLPTAFALGRRWWTLVLAVLVPLGLAAIYGFPPAIFTNLFGDFTYVSRLNDLVWWLVEDTVSSNYHQRYFRYDFAIIIVATVCALVWRYDWKRGLLWSMGAVLVLAPVLPAWYVCWILPFACWRRARAWTVLSITIFAYYLFFNERLFALPWHAEPWLRGVIILPVLFALLTNAVARIRPALAPLPR